MTPSQIDLIQESFKKVQPISEAAAALFYKRLFEIAPEVRPLFKRDISEQGRLLMAILAAAVSLLRQPDKLVPAVEDLGRRHAGYGVKPEHFTPVGQALIWTLEQGLGEAFTPQVREAWLALYETVQHVMLKGMQQGSSAAAG